MDRHRRRLARLGDAFQNNEVDITGQLELIVQTEPPAPETPVANVLAARSVVRLFGLRNQPDIEQGGPAVGVER